MLTPREKSPLPEAQRRVEPMTLPTELFWLMGTIDFYHFIPLSLTLSVPGGHKVNAKQNLLVSFSTTLLI